MTEHESCQRYGHVFNPQPTLRWDPQLRGVVKIQRCIYCLGWKYAEYWGRGPVVNRGRYVPMLPGGELDQS